MAGRVRGRRRGWEKKEEGDMGREGGESGGEGGSGWNGRDREGERRMRYLPLFTD